MPAGPGEDAERFAAAVELGRSPGSRGDDELARDLEIVAMLRSRGRALDPNPAAKAQAKQQLMALLAGSSAKQHPRSGRLVAPPFPAPPFPAPQHGAPDAAATELLPRVPAPASASRVEPPPGDVRLDGFRAAEPQSADTRSVEPTRIGADVDDQTDDEIDIDADGEAEAGSTGHRRPVGASRFRRPAGGRHSLPSRPAGRAADQRRSASSGRRFTLVGSAAMLLALALAGAGILASRDALPGERLYDVKRVAESAGLALTFDDMSRARRHLDLASTRLGEVEQLVAADPKVSTEDPELVNSAIQQFDDSTGEGARMLLADDAAAGSRDDLASWAAEQSERLADLQPALPAGTQTEDALRLLHRVVGRSQALQSQASCTTPPGGVDDLGPVPSCLPAGADPNGDSSESGSGRATDPAAAGVADDPTGAGGPTGSTARTGPGSAGASGSGGAGTTPNTSRRAPAQNDDPGLLDPVEDNLNGVLGGSSNSQPSSSSTAPRSDDDSSSDTSDSSGDKGGGGGGGGLPGLPPVDLSPLLPGLGL